MPPIFKATAVGTDESGFDPEGVEMEGMFELWEEVNEEDEEDEEEQEIDLFVESDDDALTLDDGLGSSSAFVLGGNSPIAASESEDLLDDDQDESMPLGNNQPTPASGGNLGILSNK